MSALAVQALGAFGATAAGAEEGRVETDVLRALVGQGTFGQSVQQASPAAPVAAPAPVPEGTF